MKRDEAVGVLQLFFKNHKVESTGLNDNDLGGVALGTTRVAFEFVPELGELKCYAPIYRFHNPARQEILVAGEKYAKAHHNTLGGGILCYLSKSQTWCLEKTYSKKPSSELLAQDILKLAEASNVWATDVIPKLSNT